MTANMHGPAKEMRARFLTERNGPITYSIKTPSFKATIIMDPKLPRMSGGEISPKYIGVLEKAIPKASPDIHLDKYSSCKAKKE